MFLCSDDNDTKCSKLLKASLRGTSGESVGARWPSGCALERGTGDRVVLGSNLAGATFKLWQFRLRHFASVFRMRR